MSKKKPIQVTIQETKHPTQPWVYVVDYGGNKIPQKGKLRYTRATSAKMGCARAEAFYRHHQYDTIKGSYVFIGYKSQDGREVVFTTKRRK